MHIPAPLRPAFKRRALRWLGKDASASSINIRGIRYGRGLNQLNQLKGVLRYCLKNIAADAGGLLKIEPRARDRVPGKRLGVAQCIGPAARTGRLRKRPGKASGAQVDVRAPNPLSLATTPLQGRLAGNAGHP